MFGRIDLRGPQVRHQQLLAAEHIQRQKAVVVVSPWKKRYLPTVHRIIGGVEESSTSSVGACWNEAMKRSTMTSCMAQAAARENLPILNKRGR